MYLLKNESETNTHRQNYDRHRSDDHGDNNDRHKSNDHEENNGHQNNDDRQKSDDYEERDGHQSNDSAKGRVVCIRAVVVKSLVGLVSANFVKNGPGGGEERSYFMLLVETRVKWTSRPPSGMLFLRFCCYKLTCKRCYSSVRNKKLTLVASLFRLLLVDGFELVVKDN